MPNQPCDHPTVAVQYTVPLAVVVEDPTGRDATVGKVVVVDEAITKSLHAPVTCQVCNQPLPATHPAAAAAIAITDDDDTMWARLAVRVVTAMWFDPASDLYIGAPVSRIDMEDQGVIVGCKHGAGFMWHVRWRDGTLTAEYAHDLFRRLVYGDCPVVLHAWTDR